MYGRNRYLTDPIIFAQIQDVHRRFAAEQARELGLLDPNGDGSFTRPSLDRLIYADGKVVAPLYKAKPGTTRVDKETGEIFPVRFEADADLHMQGDGEMAWGVKFVITAARSSDVHGRIILDAQHVPEKGGEAKFALESFKAIAPHAPGIQGVIYDTALRGVHHVTIQTLSLFMTGMVSDSRCGSDFAKQFAWKTSLLRVTRSLSSSVSLSKSCERKLQN